MADIDLDMDFYDDLVEIESVNEADETLLRNLIKEVEKHAKLTKPIKPGILSAQQWANALDRHLPPAIRRVSGIHFMAILDSKDPWQLLVGPSTVRGINARDPRVVTEVVYKALGAGSHLPTIWLSGLTELLATSFAEGEFVKREKLEVMTRMTPVYAEFLSAVIECLQAELGFDQEQYLLELRNQPARFFMGLQSSEFAMHWLQNSRSHPRIMEALKALNPKPRVAFAQLIKNIPHDLRNNVIELTLSSRDSYLAVKKEKKA